MAEIIIEYFAEIGIIVLTVISGNPEHQQSDPKENLVSGFFSKLQFQSCIHDLQNYVLKTVSTGKGAESNVYSCRRYISAHESRKWIFIIEILLSATDEKYNPLQTELCKNKICKTTSDLTALIICGHLPLYWYSFIITGCFLIPAGSIR